MGGKFAFGGSSTASTKAVTLGSGGFSFGLASSSKSNSAETKPFTFGGISAAAPKSGFTFGNTNTPGSSAFASKDNTPSLVSSDQAVTKDLSSGASASTKTVVPPSAKSESYPPIASKAPTPFGTTSNSPTISKATSSSQSGYPPMSIKAPKPFTSSTKKETSSSDSGYPPMAAKAPKPFNKPKPTEAMSNPSSGGYPPMSSKAPKPFTSSTKKEASLSSGSNAPIASNASNPFIS